MTRTGQKIHPNPAPGLLCRASEIDAKFQETQVAIKTTEVIDDEYQGKTGSNSDCTCTLRLQRTAENICRERGLGFEQRICRGWCYNSIGIWGRSAQGIRHRSHAE
jgi:hypothetical protein